MTITAAPPVLAAERIADTIGALSATIDGWRDALEARLSVSAAPTAETLDPVVGSLVLPVLAEDGLITGAGFVAAPGLLADARWHLAWWLRQTEGVNRLATVEDPASEQFRDYTGLEWWRGPAGSGARHLTGPYVDYVCTDDYTVTITTPVSVNGRLLGVVGADALVDRLEQVVLPVLRTIGRHAALVNAAGRVVTATDARRDPGSVLRLEGLADALRPAHPSRAAVLPGGAQVLLCGDTTLRLVVG